MVGLGLLVRRAWFKSDVSLEGHDLWMAFWVGYGAVVALLQVYHLFLPVDLFATLGLVALGLIGLFICRGSLGKFLCGLKFSWGAIIIAVLVLVWLANRAIGPPIGDSGIYHLGVIKWNSAYRIVPGLGNLHGRFAFNNASLLWPSLFEFGYWQGRSFHLMNGIFVAVFSMKVLSHAKRALGARNGLKSGDIFGAFLVTPLVTMAIGLYTLRISTPNTDIPATLVALAASWELYRLLSADVGNLERRQANTDYRYLFVTVLFALSICLKLSMIAYGGSALILTMWFRFYSLRTHKPFPTRLLLFCIVVPSLLIIPFMVRGAILSGYLLYPSHILQFAAQWQVPSRLIEFEISGIRDHFMPSVAQAMMKGPGDWFRPWIIWQVTRSPELILLPAALSLFAVFWLAKGQRAFKSEAARRVFLLFIPIAAGLVLWLKVAPAPRFGFFMVWIVAALLLTKALRERAVKRQLFFRIIFVVLIVFPILHREVAWFYLGRSDNMLSTLILPPGPDGGFYPAPVVDLVEKTTASGFMVFVPVKGDKCWNAPLPCTPYLRKSLRLRRPGDLGGGFLSK